MYLNKLTDVQYINEREHWKFFYFTYLNLEPKGLNSARDQPGVQNDCNVKLDGHKINRRW